MNLLVLLWNSNMPDRAPVTPGNQFLSSFEWYIFYPLLVLFGIVFLITFLFTQKEIINHWSMLFPHFTYSSKAFYQELINSLMEHGVDKIKYTTKNRSVGSMVSGKRIYLQVQWREYTYDVCAAPFGDGYFFSYWGRREPHRIKFAVSKIPWIGAWLARLIFPDTFYSIDTDTMFHTLFHACMVDLVNKVGKEKNMPPLTEKQTTPQMKDIFAR